MKVRRYSSIFFLAPWIAALMLIRCWGEQGSTPGSSSSSVAPPATTTPEPVAIEPIDIALDESSGTGEVSLRRNLYVVFDGSGSMRGKTGRDCGGDQEFESKLDGAVWALNAFLDKVPADVNLGLYVFDRDGRREVVSLGRDRAAFLDAVSAIRAGGRTPLADGIRFATDQLVRQYREQLGYGEFRLVVVTDGKASAIPDAVTYASRWGMPIYAIGLCLREEHPLRQLAVSYRAADRFEDLAQGLEETLAELPSFDPTAFPGIPDDGYGDATDGAPSGDGGGR